MFRLVNYAGQAVSAAFIIHNQHVLQAKAERSGASVLTTVNYWLQEILAAVFFFASEADRMWMREARTEASDLRRDFTGKVCNSTSSMGDDKVYILREIRANGEEAAVDYAIDVLLRAGMSTPSLRAAALHGVDVEAAGRFRV